jgi:ParB-like chromosome segregation protein Spo0J
MRSVAVGRLVLPGDMPKVRATPAAAEMARSFAMTGGGPAEPILVDTNMHLLAGRRRVAAALNKGVKFLNVVMFDGTDEELAKITDVENAIREHDTAKRDEALARLVGKATKEPPPEAEPPKAKRGRPRTKKGEAVRKVAEELGVPERRVRDAVKREEAESEPEAEPPIATMGLSVPEAVLESAANEREFLESFVKRLTVMAADFTRHRNQVQRGADYYGNANQILHDVSASLAQLVPTSICLWCKCTIRQQECMGCGGLGWLTSAQVKQITDPKLLAVGKRAGIYVDGEFVLLEAFDASV